MTKLALVSAATPAPAVARPIALTSKGLTALKANASVDPTREHLGGVYFTSTSAWSTDGHTLTLVGPVPTDAESKSARWISSADVAFLTKIAGAKGLIQYDAQHFLVTACDAAGIPIEGATRPTSDKYTSPPAGQVVPDRGRDTSSGAIGVAPRYLARVAAAATATMGGRGESGIAWSTGGQLDPIRVDWTDADGFAWIVVVMPVRL